MIWSRPSSCPRMHAIRQICDVAAETECGATFLTPDVVEIDDAPEHNHRCGDCRAVLAQRRLGQNGNTPDPIASFDVRDGEVMEVLR